MDNFINRQGNHFDAYWIIHGTPQGLESNSTNNDPVEFVSYANFHRGGDTHIDFPSKPGEKFIKETLVSGAVAYTFLHTGIRQITSDRDGSNYGAITIIMDDMSEKDSKKFEGELKNWFTKNILDIFTYKYNDGWLKWNDKAGGLFRGNYDKQLKNSIQSIIEPYISNQNTDSKEKTGDSVKTDRINAGIQKLKEEIAKLEQQKQEIERKLAEKYTQLKNM
jgi:hypothetical protein